MSAVSGPLRRDALIGRRREQQMLANVLSAARQDRSGVLVIRGEAGIGKTALLADAVASTNDFRILQVSGGESELERRTRVCNSCAARCSCSSTDCPNRRARRCTSLSV